MVGQIEQVVTLPVDRSGAPVCIRRNAQPAGTAEFRVQISTSRSGWLNVALCKHLEAGRGAYASWGYNPRERRWAYGDVPPAEVVAVVQRAAGH